jgi:hypothetical protein
MVGCYRQDLLNRAKALQKKQRVGQGAPPTPTLRFSSVSSTPTAPDFTPVHPARRQGFSSTPTSGILRPSWVQPPIRACQSRDLTFTHPPIFDTSPHGPERVRSLPRLHVTSQTPAAHPNAKGRSLPQSPRMRTAASINFDIWKRLVPIRNPVNRRVELARSRT